MRGQTTRAACLQGALADLPRFVLDPQDPAFIHLASARKHLRSLPAERRAQLEREWHEGGFDSLNEATPDSLKARAAAEWREHTGEGLYD